MIEEQTYQRVKAELDKPYTSQGAEVLAKGSGGRVVFSARIPAELTDEIAAVASEGGVSPSAAIAQLVAEALQARRLRAGGGMVDVAVLHRLIDQAAKAA